MAENSYAQLIDDFENGINVLKGESLTDYIKRMGGVDYESKADGGAIGIEVLFKKKNGGSINSPKSKNIKGQDHMLAYITPNEAKKLEALGGKETMTKEGIPAYPEWDSMYGAESKQAFDAGKAPKGNVNWSGGGGGGNNNQKKPVYVPPEIKEAAKTGLLNLGLNKLGIGKYVHPALAIKGVYDYFKNPEITEEDVTLGKTSEVTTDLPSENLLAFTPGSIKDKKLKKLHNQKKEGLMWNEQNEKTYQQLLEEDKESETPTVLSADGGRVGFNQGGWADGLEGEAKGIYDSMTAYGASDAEIQSKLQTQGLWSPDGTTTDTEQVTGIINQNIGGDNFSPFNPDPNKVRTDYRPNYDYRKSLDYNPEVSDLQNQKIMQNTLNYKGHDYYNKPAPTGLEKAINTGINFIPGIGGIKRGMEFFGGILKDVLPVNQRAIMENELRGSGIYTDDIGRIVAGPDGYNTPEGIMAGYNAYHMDPAKENNAWDRRTDTITDSLVDKAKDLGLNITKAELMDIAKEIEETGKYSGTLTDKDFGVKNLFSNLTNVNLNKYMVTRDRKKADDIAAFKAAEKERKAFEAAKAKQITTVPTQLGGGDGQSGGDYAGGAAFAAANPYGGSGTMDEQGADSFAFKKGGLASMFTRRR